MADIRPFAAYRPREGRESAIAALPYDVFSSAEARTYVAEHPESFLAIDRAETSFDESVAFDDPRVYEHASKLLRAWMENGTFVQDDAPFYYIYEQTFRGRTQSGIVALASIDDYISHVIKKHENTRADKEMDRIQHVDICNAQTGPIFLCYRPDPVIREIVRKNRLDEPYCEFDSEGGVHNRLFRISDNNECQIIRHCFGKMDSVYIADGHHRCASAVKVGLNRRSETREKNGGNSRSRLESDYFLSVLFPSDELEILDYNRVLKDLGGRSESEILSLLTEYYEVGDCYEQQIRPKAKGEVGLLLSDGWRLLRVRENLRSNDPVQSLDVSFLQSNVLAPVFNIQDPRTDSRIDFVGGIRGLDELERRVGTDCAAAFAMYPTSLDELLSVADAGMLMPPKSTWFEPKLLSGLFIHDLATNSQNIFDM